MHEHVSAFLQSASEAFGPRGPVYEFGYSPIADSAGAPTLPGDGSEEDSLVGRDGRRCEPAKIEKLEEPERLEDLVPLPYPNGVARTVISINTLEHAFEPRRAVEEMIRILAPGGLLLISSASGGQACERPDCYWRPTPCAIQRLLAGLDATLIGWQGTHPNIDTSFAIASKPPAPETFAAGVNRFLDRFQRRLDEAAEPLGWRQRLARLFSRYTPPKPQFVLHLPARGQLEHALLSACLPEENSGARFDASR
jgi:SAM-dependent methyltransferase